MSLNEEELISKLKSGLGARLRNIKEVKSPFNLKRIILACIIFLVIISGYKPTEYPVKAGNYSPNVGDSTVEWKDKIDPKELREGRKAQAMRLEIAQFAMLVSAFCLVIAVILLIFSLPIYIFTDNDRRMLKAGMIVKSSMGFIFMSGTGVLGTLSFVA